LAGLGGSVGSDMVKRNLERTAGTDNGIITYDLYWVLSTCDYVMHTADFDTLVKYAPNVLTILSGAMAFWSKPANQHFCGSDERIGADFDGANQPEMERYYKMLGVQATVQYASVMAQCGAANVTACPASLVAQAIALNTTAASNFEAARTAGWGDYGMHSAAGAVGTGLTTEVEEQAIFASLLSNPAHICSFAPFNSYFILATLGKLRLLQPIPAQSRGTAGAGGNGAAGTGSNGTAATADAAGGRMEAMRAALDMVRRCFHGMNRLGATTYWETFSPEWNDLFEYGDPTPNSQTGHGVSVFGACFLRSRMQIGFP
jgi:hypothetical protein